jgi:hypothetical protein
LSSAAVKPARSRMSSLVIGWASSAVICVFGSELATPNSSLFSTPNRLAQQVPLRQGPRSGW